MALVSRQIREVTGVVVDSLVACETAGTQRDAAEVNVVSVLSSLMAGLGDAGLTGIVRDAAAARAQFDLIVTVGAGLILKRSERELGYAGLAAREGHRSPVGLVQSLTGESRGEAARQVRFGEAIGEADAAVQLAGGDDGRPVGVDDDGVPEGFDSARPVDIPWFEPITRAVAAGVSARAEERYANRKARLRRTDAGVLTGWLEFDDESGNLIEGIIRSGLSPRLGGPRFVDKDKAAAAQALLEDPRSYEQLVFDLLMAVLKAGTLADPDVLLGGQQHGLRVVITQDELDKRDDQGNLAGTGFVEDTGETVPPATIQRMLCDTGVTEITVDGDGDPLKVGREHRLFTAKQRVALAIRDGGCMAENCPFPASMTEAHHVQEWYADHGRTDLADGILLCKFDHMRVHNQGWKIVRDGNRYNMVPPAGIDPPRTPILLESKAPWRRKKKKTG